MKEKEMNTIKINGEEYVIKYTIRALFMWEQITGKPFKINTLLDNYIFFYCMLLSNNKDKVLDWDSYLDALDNDTTLFSQMTEIVNKAEEEKKVFDNSSASSDTTKDGEKKS